MARSQSFPRNEEPFEHDDSFSIDRRSTHGPFRGLAPTQTTLSYSASRESAQRPHSYGTVSQRQPEEGDGTGGQQDGELNDCQGHEGPRRSNVEYKWTSRNSRKGRHTLLVGERSFAHDADYGTPDPTNGLSPTLKGLWRMITKFPLNDLSYLTATSFVVGCTLLVVQAFLTLLPLLDSDIQLPQGATYAQAWLNFAGCSFFLLSSSLSYLEAVNANKEGCFGWSPEQTAPSGSNDDELALGVSARLVPDKDCDDWHTSGYRHEGKNGQSGSRAEGTSSSGQGPRMRMFPTLHELKMSYFYDLGFMACFTLFVSSGIFWVSSLSSLITTMIGVQAPWIRIIQLIATSGFAVSSAIFAIETQDHWSKPAPHMLGWHIGFWNFIGSCGFALFAACALAADVSFQTQSSVHYFWGCWGFLVGSLIQWYESLDKHPVERKD